MSERIAAIKQDLANARGYLNRVLDAVGDRWDAQIYSDGLGWSVKQLTHHLADADKGHNWQVMNIAEGNEVIPPDFDIERFNKRSTEKNVEKTVDQSRAELAETRALLNTWLDTLDEAKLDQKGRHATLQIMTVQQIFRVMCVHEIEHARDIAKALEIDEAL